MLVEISELFKLGLETFRNAYSVPSQVGGLAGAPGPTTTWMKLGSTILDSVQRTHTIPSSRGGERSGAWAAMYIHL